MMFTGNCLTQAGVDLLLGRAGLVDAHTVMVNAEGRHGRTDS